MLRYVLLLGTLLVAILLAWSPYSHSFDKSAYPDPLQQFHTQPDDTSVRRFEFPDLSKEWEQQLKDTLRQSPFHPDNPAWNDTRTRQLSSTGFGLDFDLLSRAVQLWASDVYTVDGFLRRIGRHPHFETTVLGHAVHFLHIKRQAAGRDAPVILMLHGWPGSFVEFLDVADSDHLAKFDLVIPSLPGYGFSAAPRVPEFDCVAHADVMAALMARLGYDRYVVQGGDWGSMVATIVAQQDPHCIALHSNFAPMVPTPATALFAPFTMSDDDYAALRFPPHKLLAHLMGVSGYMHAQATRPDSLGAVLMASPVSLLAWILEKVVEWADPVTRPSDTFILDNIMVYYVSGSIASSLRLYQDHLQSPRGWAALFSQVHLPTAIADFPKEVTRTTQAVAEAKFANIVRFNTFTSGGHFAAAERPVVFACDVAAFVAQVWGGVPQPRFCLK